MKFTISSEVFTDFPDTSVGLVVAKNVDNSKTNSELKNLLKESQEQVRFKFENTEIFDNPTIKAWRQAYKRFGAEKYRASIEALVKRTLKGDELNQINNLVDLYNYISLKYVLPVGGENLDKIEGDVFLQKANGSEKFIPLFQTEVERIKENEIIYWDGVEVICRRWNWREADRTKITEDTKNVIFEVEGIIVEDKDRVKEAIAELAELIKKYCNGNVETYFLDSNNRIIEFLQ